MSALCSVNHDDMCATPYQVGGDHYARMSVQPWDAMEAWLTPEQFEGYMLGSAIKYLARAGKKGDAQQDIEKARHYLDRLIQSIEDN